MIAIYNAKGIKEWDQYTIDQKNIRSIELMEQAAQAFCDHFLTLEVSKDTEINIFCGPGNNGGDGYAIARLLRQASYPINIFKVNPELMQSPDCLANESLIKQKPDVRFTELSPHQIDIEAQLKSFNGIAIDAIFGSGLSRPLESWYADLVDTINQLFPLIISVDIPSGVFTDKPSNIAIESNLCISFQSLKACMIHPSYGRFAEQTQIVDIGLSEKFENENLIVAWQLQASDLYALIRTRKRFSHKGDYGHALLVAGFQNMVGAGLLASKAALRSGIGKLSIHTNREAYLAMVTAQAELMYASDLNHLTKYQSMAIGPGLGTDKAAIEMVSSLLHGYFGKLCLDADALNIIAQEGWQDQIPAYTVLTPHPLEFKRLFGESANGFVRLEKQISISKCHQIYIIYKDAYTILTCPQGEVFVSTYGNPGMATGGSGDVLTGILAAFMAQNDLSILDACKASILVHGIAGDLASKKYSEPGMIPSDMTKLIPEVFNQYYGKISNS